MNSSLSLAINKSSNEDVNEEHVVEVNYYSYIELSQEK